MYGITEKNINHFPGQILYRPYLPVYNVIKLEINFLTKLKNLILLENSHTSTHTYAVSASWIAHKAQDFPETSPPKHTSVHI